MKEFKQPPFQQNAVAIAFTIGVHAIAIVGLLYLGMSKPPEPPKQIKTVLIKPEDLKPVTREVTDFEETAHQNVKEEITQTADPVIDAPAVPVTPPVNMQQAATEAKKAEQQKNLAEQKAAEDARLAKAKAIEEANAKAAADAKAKAAADANAKATADAKAKAAADAKAKAAADAKAKAAADAKAKATADAKAKAAAEAEAKASSARKAAEEAATKKAEAKRIASSAKKDFTNKIYRNWNTPSGSSGKTASARVTLSDSGSVLSVVVNASDPDMKASIEAAIRSAAPYPMPSDPDARREARTFTSSFTSK